ncbi:DinB family protein [Streptomyces sp. NBC_00117]
MEGRRRHVHSILDGLDDDALRRPALPSEWNCLVLVHGLPSAVMACP